MSSRRSSAVLNTSPSRTLEIDPPVHDHRHRMVDFQAYPHPIIFETLPLQGARLSGLDRHYTQVISGKGKTRQALESARQRHHISQLRLWFLGVARSRQERFQQRRLSHRTALEALWIRNRMQYPEHVRFHNHLRAPSRSCPLQARWFTKRTILIWTFRQDRAHGKCREALTATTDATRSRLHLSKLTRPPLALGQYPVLRPRDIYGMAVPFHTRRINLGAP